MSPMMCTQTKYDPPFSPPSPPPPSPSLRHTRQQRRANLNAAIKVIEKLEARVNGMRRNTKETVVIFEGLRESLTDTPAEAGEQKEDEEETKRGEVGAIVKREVVKKVVLRVSV
ncbi:uncharacterized protein H6S33_008362 [Morchella sextelata]|uniref:uncharacterized protein n=1 Tax=Morchella sextelata TaxID=1174677 RepID=UPI001D053944|nr:uncharacterized protein H6S33_008362 [Morchella sextelata]KAH0602712.1 hypothetical protein H6S33_008362 [Morchella sextelata]